MMSVTHNNSRDSVSSIERIHDGLKHWLVREDERGLYGVDRQIYTDPDLFNLEMKYIFERNWVFIAHESQLPKPNDFITTHIGSRPVLLLRNRAGDLKCFLNACTHRGSRLCREKIGNRKTFMCPFHGWTFGTDGDLLDVTDEESGGYSRHFDRKNYGLEHVARLDSYRGFVFASLSGDVEPLADYLGGAKLFIDLLVEQSPRHELEILRGVTRYTYEGNWKLQAENGIDGYHVGTVHANYVMTVIHRLTGESDNKTKTFDFTQGGQAEGGFFTFGNGHAVMWVDYMNNQDRPNYEALEYYKKEYGEERAKWMNGRLRNTLLYPNLMLMDQTSTQLRIIRPISVNETEVVTYCIAPVGESDKARAIRIRQYEDFLNASGMATPDDLTEFENCQMTYGPDRKRLNDLSRGATRWGAGQDKCASAMHVDAAVSGEHVTNEGIYVALHEDWMRRMQVAVAEERTELGLGQ